MAMCLPIGRQGFVHRLPLRLLHYALHIPEEPQFIQPSDSLRTQLSFTPGMTLPFDPVGKAG